MDFRQKLIGYIKSTKGVSLASNKEYYSRIDFVNEKFIYRSGDPVAIGDAEKREISEEEVFRIVKERFGPKFVYGSHTNVKIESDEELFNFVVKFVYS